MKVVCIGTDTRIHEITELAVHLRWPNVTLEIFACAGDGIDAIKQSSPDVIFLHPALDDFTLNNAIQEIRRFSQAPLLVLGKDGDIIEVIASIELGADDYIRLPCDLTEIMARISAVLRRVNVQVSYEVESPLRSGPLYIDPATWGVLMNGQRIHFFPKEFHFLYALMKKRGAVVTYQTLKQKIWGKSEISSSLIKKYAQNIRVKLNDNARCPYWIANIQGVGYRFTGPPPI